MKFSEIKNIISALEGRNFRLRGKIAVTLAINRIEFIGIENDHQFDAVCAYVYDRHNAYLDNDGKADAFIFCSAIEAKLRDCKYDENASFNKKFKFLKELDWEEVGRDADEILENF